MGVSEKRELNKRMQWRTEWNENYRKERENTTEGKKKELWESKTYGKKENAKERVIKKRKNTDGK